MYEKNLYQNAKQNTFFAVVAFILLISPKQTMLILYMFHCAQ